MSEELFSPQSLAPLPALHVRAQTSRFSMLCAQWIELPRLARANPNALFIFPGYPPSLAFPMERAKSIMYIHDLFLLTRQSDLNFAGKVYLAPQFRRAVRLGRAFLCNSECTAKTLRQFCSRTATIMLARPIVKNVFGVSAKKISSKEGRPSKLKVVSVGTVEPRKNFSYGVKICQALSRILGVETEYHIIGRKGWGGEWEELSSKPDVTLHGYLTEVDARRIIETADLALCTSHDEGLGLPLLELQYAGLPVAAPDLSVFQEVLGTSGILFPLNDAEAAAAEIARGLEIENGQHSFASAGQRNILRWNENAAADLNRIAQYLRAAASKGSF